MTGAVHFSSASRLCPQGQPDERRMHDVIHVITCSIIAKSHMPAARVTCLQLRCARASA